MARWKGRLLTTKELAARLGTTQHAIENRRYRGEDLPPCVRLGKRSVRYPEDAVEWWIDQRTDEAPSAA